ncbi:4'-phosphopantetheinyl transferase family protein [Parapedobacter soli]|uniref:4'-phosphopantetheinyl transferase family protein n=1 Tax=Parapedobacter soli TaxID=416955 RepID=UPI0021C885AE|nr:4'-phosphopantetheinyl transferase superfamily protein [Parapedobacter soli]
MSRTAIIATWINEPQRADGWAVIQGNRPFPRPSVWLINPTAAHALLAHRYDNILNNDELARAARFHQQAHQIRYQTTHTVLRLLLAGATQLAPTALHFVGERHNKPSLSPHSGNSVAFNLSYTENKSLIGIANGKPIGVDIEWLNRPLVIDDMLDACFSASEIDYITSQEEGTRRRFFTLWTRKEAILKLTGEGIGEHLPLFEVLDGTGVAKNEIIGGNPPHQIFLYSFPIGSDYLGCYAASEPLEQLPIFQL